MENEPVPGNVRLSDGLGLVEKLRGRMNAAKWTRGLDTDYAVAWVPDELCNEAAAEIERLTAQRLELQAEREQLLARLAHSGVEARREVAAKQKQCADWVEARLHAFCAEHGSMDPDTGALEFGSGAHAQEKEEYACELAEIADALRALGPNSVLTGACAKSPGA